MTEKEIYTIFGKRLRLFRERRNKSQRQLAKEMNISTNTSLSSWEMSKTEPGLIRLMQLCELLDVTPNDLLYDKDTFPVLTDEDKEIICLYQQSGNAIKSIVRQTLSLNISGTNSDVPSVAEPVDTGRIFLKENDSEYEKMLERMPTLIELRKKREYANSHISITRFLWEVGLNGHISVMDVKLMFMGSEKRVPSPQLYRYIESYLLMDYQIMIPPKNELGEKG